MKSSSFLAICISIFTLAVTSACAGESTNQKIEETFRKTHPGVVAENIVESPVKGMYEVSSGRNIFYYAPDGDFLLFGQIVDNAGKNLTAPKQALLNQKIALQQEKAMAGKYDFLKKNLNQALKIGDGPNEVIEIIDPDCPFCRRMNDYWKKRTGPGVTRYVIFLPLKRLHPKAEAHAAYILSAVNPVQAMDDVESGKFDHIDTPFEMAQTEVIKKHFELADKTGIDGTPAFFVNGHFVNGANFAAIEKNMKGVKNYETGK